jgi:hypothetical protein
VHFQRTSCVLLVVTLLVGPSWVAPAAADTFTATWDYHLGGGDVPDPSPFYDCDFVGSGGLICGWLWDKGLEVTDISFGPLYGDGGPYFDAFGFELPLESDIGFGDGLLRIVPKCLDGFNPCFDTFTPLTMVADGDVDFEDDSPDGVFEPGGMFFRSSKGGLLISNRLSNFAGPEWTDITWMEIGLFWPDGCGDPEGGVFCRGDEQNLSLSSLTFDADADPIPEPASVVLLGTGLLALARRYRHRA